MRTFNGVADMIADEIPQQQPGEGDGPVCQQVRQEEADGGRSRDIPGVPEVRDVRGVQDVVGVDATDTVDVADRGTVIACVQCTKPLSLIDTIINQCICLHLISRSVIFILFIFQEITRQILAYYM